LEAVLNLIVVGMVAFTLLFTVVIGGRVERTGAGIMFANVSATAVAGALMGVDPSPVVFMVIDICTALAFGALALRNPEKLWPGVAGVAMTFVMVFSATRAIGFPLSPFAYMAALNLSGLLLQGTLIAGACAHRWGRKPAADLKLAAA
jgi:hypothetical protein